MLKKLLAIAVFLPLALGASATPLRISLPPLMGAVPVALAANWNLFSEQGVEVSLVPLASQRDRMSAFRAGQLDGLVTDLTSALMLAAMLPGEVVLLGTAYYPVDQSRPHVALITQAHSGIEELAQLTAQTHLKLALPRQSDLEFALDTLLASQGLTPPTRAYVGQDNLLTNATFVLMGMVEAGVFPQPYVDFLLHYEHEGKPELVVLSWFPDVPKPPSVIVFRRSVVEERGQEIAGFRLALELAVERINTATHEELLDIGWQLAVELFFPGLVWEELKPAVQARLRAAIETIGVPVFPSPGPVPQDIFQQVLSWADEKGYLVNEVSYQEVTAALP